MKKIVSLLLMFSMVFAFAVTAYAAPKSNTSVSKDTEQDDYSDAEIIAYIKSQLNANSFDTEKEIDKAIRAGIKKFDLDISDSEIKKVTNIMLKLRSMGIESKDLAKQLDDIYKKYKPAIDAGTFSLDDISVDDLGLDKLIKKSVNNMTKKATSGVKNFFTGLFKKN